MIDSRRVWLLGVAMICAWLGGCGTCSYHALWTAEKRIQDDRLIGTWGPKEPDKDTVEHYMVTAGSEGSYRVAMSRDKDGKRQSGNYILRLVKLGTHVFAEFRVSDDDAKDLNERYGTMWLPTFMIWRIKVETDIVTLHMIDEDWLKARAKDEPALVTILARPDGGLLLTSATEKLQTFLEKYGDSRDAFRGDGAVMVRDKGVAQPAK